MDSMILFAIFVYYLGGKFRKWFVASSVSGRKAQTVPVDGGLSIEGEKEYSLQVELKSASTIASDRCISRVGYIFSTVDSRKYSPLKI